MKKAIINIPTDKLKLMVEFEDGSVSPFELKGYAKELFVRSVEALAITCGPLEVSSETYRRITE